MRLTCSDSVLTQLCHGEAADWSPLPALALFNLFMPRWGWGYDHFCLLRLSLKALIHSVVQSNHLLQELSADQWNSFLNVSSCLVLRQSLIVVRGLNSFTLIGSYGLVILPELWYISSRDKPPDKNISSFLKHCVLNLQCRNLSQEHDTIGEPPKKHGVTGCHKNNRKLCYDFQSSVNSRSLFWGLNLPLPKNPRKVDNLFGTTP